MIDEIINGSEHTASKVVMTDFLISLNRRISFDLSTSLKERKQSESQRLQVNSGILVC